MPEPSPKKPSRRTFLKRAAAIGGGVGVVGAAGAGIYLGSVNRVSRAAGKKVIVIGIDGMDPRLSESMMREGQPLVDMAPSILAEYGLPTPPTMTGRNVLG
ncbi:MAG: hypothetical protein L0241_25980 [Planctomycetia bacterium]|nr:hypothetical protein [Planctomycetia bacterium]